MELQLNSIGFMWFCAMCHWHGFSCSWAVWAARSFFDRVADSDSCFQKASCFSLLSCVVFYLLSIGLWNIQRGTWLEIASPSRPNQSVFLRFSLRQMTTSPATFGWVASPQSPESRKAQATGPKNKGRNPANLDSGEIMMKMKGGCQPWKPSSCRK